MDETCPLCTGGKGGGARLECEVVSDVRVEPLEKHLQRPAASEGGAPTCARSIASGRGAFPLQQLMGQREGRGVSD